MVKLRLKEKNMNMNKRNWVEYEIKIKNYELRKKHEENIKNTKTVNLTKTVRQ